MTLVAFLDVGLPEMMVIALVAILVFGGRLPEVMRGLGRWYAKLRHGMNEFTNPIRRELHELDVRPPTTAVPQPRPDPAPSPPSSSDTEDPHEPTPQTEAHRLPPPPRHSGGAADEPPPV